MTDRFASLQQRAAFAKSVALILCLLFLIWTARPVLLHPVIAGEDKMAQRNLRALWIGMMSYRVDYSSFPLSASPEDGPPASLTTPIAYVTSLRGDPYATESESRRLPGDASGRRSIRSITVGLSIVCAALLAGVALFPRLRQFERRRGGAGLWAAGIILAGWRLGVHFIPPDILFVAAFCALGVAAFGLFAMRRLTQGSLLLLAATACCVVLALLLEEGAFMLLAYGLCIAASLRLGLFRWTQRVRARRAEGEGPLPYFPGRSTLQPFLHAALAAAMGSLLIFGQGFVNYVEGMHRLVESAAPMRCVSRENFFVASSFGPDRRGDWSVNSLLRLLDRNGAEAAVERLRSIAYDPTNGTLSRGDLIVYGSGE